MYRKKKMLDSRIVRFKMRVVDNDRSEPTLARVVMNGVFDTEPEDEHGKYIPGEPQGPIRFQIKNPAVADLFVEGQDYYVDFVPTFQEAGSNEGA
jgi:hypothetical protein